MNKTQRLKEIQVLRSCSIREALVRLDRSGCGLLLLVSSEGELERTITDGDLRRLMLGDACLESTLEILSKHVAITLAAGNYTRQQALALMRQHSIHHIPVIDGLGHVVDLLERKDLDEQILLSTPHLGSFEREFVDEAFRSNWIAPLGPHVDGFEREIAAEVGVKHAAAVSSGTAAIHLALRLLGVSQGDRVFCSALTFIASASPIVYQGAEPVFIDSEPESWNMSPLALERALSEAKATGRLPKAVVVVHLYGQSADMDPLLELCNAYGVPVVEDAAESLGASYKNIASGSMGRMGVFSFNGNKIITTSGGGMLVSDDEELINRARFLSTQAREPALHYEHQMVGYNYRMSNILAGVGRGQLRVLKERVMARRRVFERYQEGLKHVDAIEWMMEPSWSFSNRWLSTGIIRPEVTSLSNKDMMDHLREACIEARPVWKPMQLQPVFSHALYYSHQPQESVSDRLFEAGFCLPSGSNMTEQQQDRVISVLSDFFA